MADLSVEETPVPGLLVVRLEVHEDARGWFKENWQRDKMTALGLPDFGPVQNNMSFNASRGATRGIHTEPWDKLVSVATGRVFAAWVDLRVGESFGSTYFLEIGPEVAVFVPRGVGNAYQALEDGTVYSYLVNDHWRPGISYPALALADETAAIPWPIPLDSPAVEVSVKDRANPRLPDITPIQPKRVLVVGGRGQVGRALAAGWDRVDAVAREEVDITDPASLAAVDWSAYDTVVNAAAYTDVDAAESAEGRVAAWAANATAVGRLAAVALEHRLTLVHLSSDYVYDGSRELHTEDEPLAPLGVYGQSKAAGDLAAAAVPRHYLVRTSWVVGDGRNFVRTMADLAERGVCPSVVADQVGRLTFADDLAGGIRHLVESRAPFGTYHLSSSGEPSTWADIARAVFELCGRSSADVTDTTTAQYGAGKQLAPRPACSTLDLSRIEAAGFRPRDWRRALADHLAPEKPASTLGAPAVNSPGGLR